MAFTKITQADLKSRGCTTLPNQPAISAQALKEEFDAPAKEIVAPKFNNLIDELEATTAAASLGASAPEGFTGDTIQLLLDAIALAVKTLEASQVGATPPSGTSGNNVQQLINNIQNEINNITEQIGELNTAKHTHSNKALLDTYTQTESDIADAVAKKHSHGNMSTLNKLTEDSEGNPLFNGNEIPTSGHVGGLQTFIQRDLLPPSGQGQLGDLEFVDGDGQTCDFYRYESSGWEKLNLGAYFEYDDNSVTPFKRVVVSTLDIGEDQTLPEGTLWLVYEA